MVYFASLSSQNRTTRPLKRNVSGNLHSLRKRIRDALQEIREAARECIKSVDIRQYDTRISNSNFLCMAHVAFANFL